MKAKKFALILVAVLIAALLAGCLAACNKDEKPVLTVTIGSQQVPYSPDGVQPYTDGTQVQVDGLPEGYTIELGLSAQFGGVPVPGDSAPLVFDGSVKVMNGETDVTGEFDIKATLTEGATVTVVKAVAEVNAVTEVEWDGEAHTFDVSDVVLPEGCDQQFMVNGIDKTYTDGGIYAYELVLTETDLYAAQTLEALLKIKSVSIDDTSYALEDAIAAAQTDDVIVVRHNTTFSTAKAYADASYRTVKEGVTLLLPFGDDDNGTTTQLFRDNSVKKVQAPYVTVSLPSELDIIVNGVMTVNARRSSSSTPIMGMAYYNAVLNVAAGSNVIVNDGGVFNAVGFVTGGGTVRAKSGGEICETFVISGFRGGTCSTGTYDTIVPFNQYYLNNIEATSVYEAGSKLTALGAVFGSIGLYIGVAADIPFVGASEALINLESGELRKSYDVETGIVTLTMAGECTMGNLSVSAGMGFKIDSEGKEMPFSGNFDIVLESGRITLDNVGMKLLPGASMTVGKDATLELRGESRLFVYNNKDFEWTGDTNLSAYPGATVADSYREKPALDYNIDSPAQLKVNGTVIVDATSKIGGLITSDDDGKVTFATAPAELVIKELKSTVKENGEYVYWNMTNIATLAGVESVTAGTYTYNAETATWTKA